MNFFVSKMAGSNIPLNLNERQSSSDKKHNISLRLVLFFPFAVVLPAFYSFFYRQWNKRTFSTPISEMFFTFLGVKNLRENPFSQNVYEEAL